MICGMRRSPLLAAAPLLTVPGHLGLLALEAYALAFDLEFGQFDEFVELGKHGILVMVSHRRACRHDKGRHIEDLSCRVAPYRQMNDPPPHQALHLDHRV